MAATLCLAHQMLYSRGDRWRPSVESLPNRPLRLFFPTVVLHSLAHRLLYFAAATKWSQSVNLLSPFFGLRLTFVHNGGTCDQPSTKAKHEACHWPHATTTPRKRRAHYAADTVAPRRDLIPQRPPRRRETHYSWFLARNTSGRSLPAGRAASGIT